MALKNADKSKDSYLRSSAVKWPCFAFLKPLERGEGEHLQPFQVRSEHGVVHLRVDLRIAEGEPDLLAAGGASMIWNSVMSLLYEILVKAKESSP